MSVCGGPVVMYFEEGYGGLVCYGVWVCIC